MYVKVDFLKYNLCKFCAPFLAFHTDISTSSGKNVRTLGANAFKSLFHENMFLKLNWDQGRYKLIDCRGHKDRVLSVTFDSRRIATGGKDGVIKLWSLRDGHCLQTLQGHSKGVWCLDFLTKLLLVSGSYDSTIKVSVKMKKIHTLLLNVNSTFV